MSHNMLLKSLNIIYDTNIDRLAIEHIPSKTTSVIKIMAVVMFCVF